MTTAQSEVRIPRVEPILERPDDVVDLLTVARLLYIGDQAAAAVGDPRFGDLIDGLINDDLRGGDDDDTFIMTAGFSRDDVDGGNGSDMIVLDSVLTQPDVDDVPSWLSPDQGYTHVTADNTITFSASASGTIDLGGGNEITFANIEQIDYALVG